MSHQQGVAICRIWRSILLSNLVLFYFGNFLHVVSIWNLQLQMPCAVDLFFCRNNQGSISAFGKALCITLSALKKHFPHSCLLQVCQSKKIIKLSVSLAKKLTYSQIFRLMRGFDKVNLFPKRKCQNLFTCICKFQRITHK